MPSVLIAGASGLVGSAVLERYLANDRFDVVALSRRAPEVDSRRPFRWRSVDLLDRAATEAALDDLPPITHLVYAALYEKPGLLAGWSERDQMETNLAMLEHCLAPLLRDRSLRHVTLMQGTKAYGAHLHPIPIPARERAPRDPHENFYWLQEDHVTEQARRHGFGWTILRPQLIVGRAWGVAMNVVPVIGAYAALLRDEGRPFSFPGGLSAVREAVDVRVVAEAIEWAGCSPLALNEHFNVTNGDVYEWRNLWPQMAATLGVELGADEPRSVVEYLAGKDAAWERIVERHGLRPIALGDLVGESHHLADHVFGHGADEPPHPRFTSRIKLQQAGFGGCHDTAETFTYWLRDLVGRRVLPGAATSS
jgi:nucleoside-diphosphate-sugar epimerase